MFHWNTCEFRLSGFTGSSKPSKLAAALQPGRGNMQGGEVMRRLRTVSIIVTFLLALTTGRLGAFDFFSYWGAVCDGSGGHWFQDDLAQNFQTGCHCASQACEAESEGGFCVAAADYCEEYCDLHACGVFEQGTFCDYVAGWNYDCACQPC